MKRSKFLATRIPIIAAGGIFDGFDIFKFLALGAASVQKGTRFVATSECGVDDAFKQAYITSEKEDMVIINSPVVLQGRVIRSAFVDQIKQGM